ncbi:hypothetical protein NKH18_24780 [Streptomyces sp. M10(2022)]
MVDGAADHDRRLLHVTQFTASAQDSPTVGTTHLLAALLDEAGTNAESAAEIERVLTESGWTSPRCGRSRSSGSQEERSELPEAAAVRQRV